MNENQFWVDVDAVANLPLDERIQVLRVRARSLSLADLTSWDEIATSLRLRAHTAELWGAAYLVDSCGDDAFDYFKCWLILQGRSVYERVVEDPDSLAACDLSSGCAAEAFAYIASEEYTRRTGRDMPPGRGVRRPDISLWDFDNATEMRNRYPRLWRLLAPLERVGRGSAGRDAPPRGGQA
jgi:hypothetical protein